MSVLLERTQPYYVRVSGEQVRKILVYELAPVFGPPELGKSRIIELAPVFGPPGLGKSRIIG
jgi:hypothetical protein